ncbi:MAG: methionine biosynthesis protein MetW [Gammaproteobacteria bacterium]
MNAAMTAERIDFARIAGWIKRGARVLDLGCEDGAMLSYLAEKRGAECVGVDINPANLTECLRRGVSAVMADINGNLPLFADDSFDVVVLSQTLQSIRRPPPQVLAEMLRVGKEAIVSFPNFGHWRMRLQVLGGKMPTGRRLPYQWFDTPNVRYCTIRDFEALCRTGNIQIADRVFLSGTTETKHLPNARADLAIYKLAAK